MTKEIKNDVQNTQVHSVITLSVLGEEEATFPEQDKNWDKNL